MIENHNTYHVKMNEKVYCDLFGGFVKGIYKGIDNKGRIIVKITTKNNPCWKYGEIVYKSALWVIPRVLYRKTGIFRYIVTQNYTFDKE